MFFFFAFFFVSYRFVDTTIRVYLCMMTEFIFTRLLCLQSQGLTIILMFISVKLVFDYILEQVTKEHDFV